MENTMKMDEKFFKGLSKFIEDEKRADIDPEDLDLVTKSFLEYIGVTLGEGVAEDGTASLECPGYITFEASYREGEDGSQGNFGINTIVGQELKTRIKGDAAIEELAE